MIFKQDWQEVYVTMDQELFMRAKDVLAGKGIDYKTDVVNNDLRAGMSNGGAVSRGGGIRSNEIYFMMQVQRKSTDYFFSAPVFE